MAIEATQLMVRAGADTSDAQADLRRFAQVVQGIGGVVSPTAQRVGQLTERIGFQQRELALLKDRLDQTIVRYGAESQQAQRLQLSVDKLSASIRKNEQALARAAQGADRFGQVWIGIQRTIGQEIVQGLGRLANSLRNVTGEALESYTGNERLSASLDALVAKELRNADATLSMSAALAQASPQAQTLLKWTQQLAINSPFGQDGVAEAFRTAQAYGFVSDSADKTVVSAKRLTSALIDFSSGSGRTEADMNRIALALGQVQAKGKLSGQEVLQLVNAGIAVDQILAKAFGKSTAEIVALREKGLIPADAAVRAIVESLESDFGGAAERQAGTMAGLLNSLEDLKKVGLREFFSGTFQAIQPYLQQFVGTLSDPSTQAQIRAFGQTIGGGVAQILPGLVDGLQAGGTAVMGLARGIQEGYQVARPLFEFLGREGTPIIVGLATAYTASLIPALTAAVPALAATGTAAVLAAAPFVALGVALAGVAKAYQGVQDAASGVADRVLAGNTAYQEATAALNAYDQASSQARSAAGAQAEALRQLQAEQHAAIEQLAIHQAVGKSAYETSAQFTRRIQAEKDAINRRTEAIQQATTDLERQVQLYGQLDGRRESIEAMRDAHEQHAQAVQISAEELEKLQSELEKIGSQGAQAAERLAQSQAAFQEAERERQAEHAQRIQSIWRESRERRAEEEAEAQQQREDRQRSHQDKLADLARSYEAQTREAEQRAAEQRQNLQEQLQQRLADLAQRATDRQEQARQQAADREQQYQDRVQEIQASAAQKTADAEQRELDRRAQSQQQYQDKLADLAQRAADIQQQAAERAADLARDHEARVADLQSSAAERAQESAERFGEDKQQRAEDHTERLVDLQEQLGKAETDAERERIQEQIDAENARYAKLEERAQRAYDRQQQQAAQALQKQLEQAERQRQRAEQEAEEQLARQQAHLAKEQATQEQAYAVAEARALAAYERARAERDREAAEQFARLEQQHAREREQAERKLAADLADLSRETEAENLEAQKRLAQQAANDAREAAQRREKYDLGVADAQQHFARQEQEAERHYQQERADQERALAEKLAAQRASFAAEEQEAAVRYAREQAEQRAHLGQLLIDYVTAEATKNERIRAHLGELTTSIAQNYGVQQSAAAESFGQSLQIIQRFADGSTPRIGEVTQGLNDLGAAAAGQQAKIDALTNEQVAALAKQFRDGKIDIDQYTQALQQIPARVQTELELKFLRAYDDIESLRLEGRASGGPVRAGTPYIVGEKRPEVFVPGQDGTILPFVPSGGGGSDPSIGSISIVVQEAQNARATALAVRDQLIQEFRRNGISVPGFTS